MDRECSNEVYLWHGIKYLSYIASLGNLATFFAQIKNQNIGLTQSRAEKAQRVMKLGLMLFPNILFSLKQNAYVQNQAIVNSFYSTPTVH